MREILFRAKRKDNGEWVEGYLTYTKSDFDKEDERELDIIPHSSDRVYQGEYNDVFVCLPETVGQYTGLTDKNGKKIFEGDIVKWNINFAVVWQDCKFVLKKDINNKSYDYVLSCFDGTELDVVCNTHDNPELLGDK